MLIDDGRLRALLVESKDLQADALRSASATLPDLQEIGAARRGRPADVDQVRAYEQSRRDLLRKGGFGVGGLAARGLLGGAFGSAVVAIVARPVAAQAGIDTQILNTASSLENLAVEVYRAALQTDVVRANRTIADFAQETMSQHQAHGRAFNEQAVALGGQEQTETNRKYAAIVEETLPTLTDALRVVEFASVLEEVATSTYVANMSLLTDKETQSIMGSVMGVEAQHLATLRAVGALLQADRPELVAIPTDVAALPEEVGSVAFPAPFQSVESASPPEEGAVR